VSQPEESPSGIRIEVRATRLAELRQARGLTQRELAWRLDVTQNYIPALEAGARQAGPRLRGPLMENLGAGFFDLFDVVLVADDAQEVQLRPLVASSRRGAKQRTGGRATDDPD
jgi:transcriptional regulator with XRE-family HTH domain